MDRNSIGRGDVRGNVTGGDVIFLEKGRRELVVYVELGVRKGELERSGFSKSEILVLTKAC